MLEAIGLDERQESAYRALVALGAAEVSDLAHRLALPRTDTERTLRHLERQGLAAQSTARLGRWVAAPPAVALGALLTRQREELEQAERAAAHLAEAYRAEAAEPAVHDLVEIVTGVGAVAQRFRQLGLGAVAEVCVLATGDPVGYGADGGAGAPAVAHRVVVARERLSAPGGVHGVTAALGRADQVRVADRVPTRLVIADRALAMVPLRELGEPSALVVHGSGLLESLLGLFEAVWRDAVPLRLGGAHGTGAGSAGAGGAVVEEAPVRPDATDLEILSLLLAGMTDARVAKHLDLGLRTVQRRVKGLMELSGVSTRLQLGWHAHANGWLTRSPG
ncbi:helix-turn-helix domain-containing protein [Streptomyces sp. NPDC048057]|uniref:helix-turn-helix domain-containing protein n=1 Tax=Streptomyces sp. NPDC048057 TaxID=3155628 RepID=UPI0033E36B47